jgi:hypothetical protein
MKAARTNQASPCHLLAQMAGCVIILELTSDSSAPRYCVERVKVHEDKEAERWRLVLVIHSKVL